MTGGRGNKKEDLIVLFNRIRTNVPTTTSDKRIKLIIYNFNYIECKVYNR